MTTEIIENRIKAAENRIERLRRVDAPERLITYELALLERLKQDLATLKTREKKGA